MASSKITKHDPWSDSAAYQYTVRFWRKVGDFWTQDEVLLKYHSKTRHKDAEKEVSKKFKLKAKDIIRVSCD